jgi:DNA (cytosine-5)-methyltransferase 1
MWCVGNGQKNQWQLQKKVGALNCMHDQQIILKGDEETENEEMIVRRLTPVECERLQNFPDNWTDIGEWTDSKGKKRKSTDSARYKALGNSIALPFWFYLLRRISAEYERPATMGSLFSGIGGFDLCWMRCNGIGTVLWESEVDDYCIAVCKKHFGDEETGEEGDIREYI